MGTGTIKSKLGSILSLFAMLSFVLSDLTVNAVAATRDAKTSVFDFPSTNKFTAVNLTKSRPSTEIHGLELSLLNPDSIDASAKGHTVLVHCWPTISSSNRENSLRFNVTKNCDRYSIISLEAIRIGIDYQNNDLDNEIAEGAIQILESTTQVASLEAMRPLESFVDQENKKTYATLTSQAGNYLASAIKLPEQVSKPAQLFSQDALANLGKVNPTSAIPLLLPPEQNSNGTLAFSYPLEFTGAREDFQPNVKISYGSTNGYGALGEGWQLEVPFISVETRWGTPQFATDIETETYLYNGQQLIPETGESYVGNPADALQLVPMAHRTTNLRPRKKGQARFVLRRDEHATRIIRHGDTPSNYWWEVWDEKPKSGVAKVMYFGHAPGRIPKSLLNFDEVPGTSVATGATKKVVDEDQPQIHGRWATTVGALRSSAINDENAQVRWELAREVSHGNIIDYDWGADEPSGNWLNSTQPSRGQYLRRVLYGSHLNLEETVLRCREVIGNPQHEEACNKSWASFEALFVWTSPNVDYVRSDARSGGLVALNRQLDRIDIRARQLLSDNSGSKIHLGWKIGSQLKWSCSLPSKRYSFNYQQEFLGQTGRRFLDAVVEESGIESELFRSSKNIKVENCKSFGKNELSAHLKNPLKTRFAYDLLDLDSKSPKGNSTREWKTSGTWALKDPGVITSNSPFKLVKDVRGALLGAASAEGKGPLSNSILGSSVTTNAAANLYLGINFLNAGKTNSFGIKSDHSKRTGYRENTLLFDINSDGLNDLVFQSDGKFFTRLGTYDSKGVVGFEDTAVDIVSTDSAFVGFGREPFQSSTGMAVEAHFFGTFLGGYHSNATTIQDIYTNDVNGDGRIDIVSKDKVLFNNSRGRNLVFSSAQDVSFIDDRNYGGLPSNYAQQSMQKLANSVDTARSTLAVPGVTPTYEEDDPRIDVVRSWRAPFSGDIIIRSDLIFDPPSEPSDLRFVPQDPDPKINEILRADRRDGLLFTVEVNKDRNWDQEGSVLRCFAHKFGRKAKQEIKLATPIENADTPVAVDSCFSSSTSTIPSLPVGLSDNDGLLITVKAGDVIYFRAHTIDNAQDDVVELAPMIDYLRLFGHSDASGFSAQPLLIYGLGSGKLDEKAVLASAALETSTCTSLPLEGSGASIEEQKVELCDPWGKSLVRYRLNDDTDEFTNGSAATIAPFDGRFLYQGTLEKGETLLNAEMWSLVVPRDYKSSDKSKVVSCPPEPGNIPTEAKLTRIAKIGKNKGSYEIGLNNNGVASTQIVQSGSQICTFLTFVSPDKDSSDESFEVFSWPEDLSAFKWTADKVSMLFDRQLVYDYPSGEPGSPAYPVSGVDYPKDQVASSSECPTPRQSPDEIKVPPENSDTLTVPENWDTEKFEFRSRCMKVSQSHWIAPRFVAQFAEAFIAVSATSTVAQANRFPSQFKKLKLPPSNLACGADDGLKSYRIRLGATTVSDEPVLQIQKPNEMLMKHAVRRTILSFSENGVQTVLPVQPITFRKRADGLIPEVWPSEYGDDLLVYDFTNDQEFELAPEDVTEKVIEQEVWSHDPPLPTGDNRIFTGFYKSILNKDKEQQLLPIEFAAYQFCAPEGVELIVNSTIQGFSSVSKGIPSWIHTAGLKKTGGCDNSGNCPISETFIRTAEQRSVDGKVTIVASNLFDTNFAVRLSDVDVTSHRGWGAFALTTGYVEASQADDGTIADVSPFSFASSPIYTEPKELPVVRRWNTIQNRHLKPESPFSDKEDVAKQELAACGVDFDTAAKCKREKILSQIRVHSLAANYKISASNNSSIPNSVTGNSLLVDTPNIPQYWTYCQENATLRSATLNEANSKELAESLTTPVIERMGLEKSLPHQCATGPDPGLWISGNFLSASRIGRKDRTDDIKLFIQSKANDLKEISVAEELALSNGPASGSKADIQPKIVRVLPRVSTTKTRGSAATAWVGLSNSDTKSQSRFDLVDINGDSFPDQIDDGSAILTDSRGRLRCNVDEVWSELAPCVKSELGIQTGIDFNRQSTGISSALSIPFTSPKTFLAQVERAVAKARGTYSPRDPGWGPSFGAEFTRSSDNRATELFDFNGDGLPDWYDGNIGQITLNTGTGFINGTAVNWGGGLFKNKSSSIGLSASIGYGNDNHEYGGGLSAATNSGRQVFTPADLNGDGLSDLLEVKNDGVEAYINNGRQFIQLTNPVAKFDKKYAAFSQHESDSITASAYFTLSPCIPVPWGCIYLVINPGASAGAMHSRQVITLKDADADGLPDLIVGGGTRVANSLKLAFENDKADVYSNPFSGFGLLKSVYLPTNPATAKPELKLAANYEFTYGKSISSFEDPTSRRVLSSIAINDGFDGDDLKVGQQRRTCFTYEGGRYDRFERQFLGFSKTVVVEGCEAKADYLAKIQSSSYQNELKGIRATERYYANASIYDSGLLLSERTTDTSSPALGDANKRPYKLVENTYSLVDVARSTNKKFYCSNINSTRMSSALKETDGGLISFPDKTVHGIVENAACSNLDLTDRIPRRLSPVLLQTILYTGEADSEVPLKTALQYQYDYQARVIGMCDLGRLGSANSQDDVCSTLTYNDTLQLSLIHGATGGGTLAYDLKDRISSVLVRSGKDGAPLRKSSAAYDVETGDLISTCQFENLNAADPCKALTQVPIRAEQLDASRRLRVSQHFLEYDEKGNIHSYLSPLAADGFFLSKKFKYDTLLSLVEVRQETDYCELEANKSKEDSIKEVMGNCLQGSTNRSYGSYRSISGEIDWRHAVATTNCDINRNGLHRKLDGIGRIEKVSASWTADAKCGASEDTISSTSWLPLITYDYRLPNLSQRLPKVRTTRHVDARTYKDSGEFKRATGSRQLVNEYYSDQLGREVRAIEAADVCIPESETSDGAACAKESRHTHIANGLTKFDHLDRPVESFMPVAMTLNADIELSKFADIPSGLPEHSAISYDGFDRPLNVKLADGNGYAFRYALATGYGNQLMHRTITRDARCVPSSTDRDVRGNISAVHEFSHTGASNGLGKHAMGSTFIEADFGLIKNRGWVKSIIQKGQQQVFQCEEGTDPVADSMQPGGDGVTRSTVTYDYDALNQLTSVHLPKEVGSAASSNEYLTGQQIKVGYDGLGRRIAIADPDRGFEFSSFDMASNLVCQRSGPRLLDAAMFGNRLSVFQTEAARTGADTLWRQNEDACLAPKSTSNGLVDRVVRQTYNYDRLTKIDFVSPVPIDGIRKNISISYGRADDQQDNRAGREIVSTDVSGKNETQRYSPIGLPEKTKRTLYSLQRAGFSADTSELGESNTRNVFDNWGRLTHTTLSGFVLGMTDKGANDQNSERKLSFNHASWYRYSPMGQIAELLVGSPCTRPGDDKDQWEVGTPDCRDTTPPIRFLVDTAFDERGNALRLEYGHGVVTRNAFDSQSNRLLSSTSRLGVPCIEFGPGDDCSNTSPPILFQNVDYNYDGAGHVTSYANAPKYADPCADLPAGQECPAISKKHAGIQGLLITGSSNKFTYDEVGRLKSNKKELSSFDRNPTYLTFASNDLTKTTESRFEVSEEFAFADNHLLLTLNRSLRSAWAGSAFGLPQTTTIRHKYAGGRPNAPDDSSIINPKSPKFENHVFGHDSRGRLDLTKCVGCLKQTALGEGQYPSRTFTWDPDDTLASGQIRTEPTEAQNTDYRRKTRYYNEVADTYDRAGNRSIKRSKSLKIRPNGLRESSALSETIYVDERLTVTRQPNKTPEALYHVLNGPVKLASKWIGGEGLFSYHAQLATGSISDIVYANGDDPTTARIHKQMEYAPFGEMIIGREATVAATTADPKDRKRLAKPVFRFNAKEYDDDSRLTFFVGRYYDQNAAFWLTPDPLGSQYMRGTPNGGVYDSKNLVAYSFANGNPVNYNDPSGHFPCKNSDCKNLSNAANSIDQSKLLSSSGLPMMIPAGVDINANLDKASKITASGEITKYLLFFLLVKNGGDWDYKQKFKTEGSFLGKAAYDSSLLETVPAELRHVVGPGDIIQNPYEEFGNWHFGFMGSAMGIPREILERGAGWAQKKAGTSGRGWSGPGLNGVRPFGDDPKDNGWINNGVNNYEVLKPLDKYEDLQDHLLP